MWPAASSEKESSMAAAKIDLCRPSLHRSLRSSRRFEENLGEPFGSRYVVRGLQPLIRATDYLSSAYHILQVLDFYIKPRWIAG